MSAAAAVVLDRARARRLTDPPPRGRPAAAAVVVLSRARARRLTDRLRTVLDSAVQLLAEAYQGQAWKALGYPSWEEYCAQELPQLAIIGRGLPVVERRAMVSELRGRGMSLRAIATPYGLAPNTVKADAAAAGVQLSQVVSIDGRARPAAGSPAPARRRRPLTDRVVALLAGAGADGLTVRDVARELRVPQHLAAPTLFRLVECGRIGYRRPARRGQFGAYVAGKVQ